MKNTHLNPIFSNFLDRLNLKEKSEKPRETIHVNEMAGSVYFIYEKMRNAVEYREQHLFRRSAIERLINRKVFVEDNLKNIGTEVIKELIKTRYLENDIISVDAVKKVDGVVTRYHSLYKEIKKSSNKKTKKYLRSVLVIAACEVENIIWPNKDEELFLNFTYNSFLKSLKVPDNTDKSILLISVYFAVHRSLWKSDLPMIEFYLFKNYPEWSSNSLSDNDKAETFISFFNFLEEIKDSAIFTQVQRKVRKNIAPYKLLRAAIFKENLREKITDRGVFLDKIRKLLAKEYYKQRQKTNRMIIQSIIYIFLTKVLLALLLEVPYEIFVENRMSLIPLTVNLIFPPAFMFILGILIPKPTEANSQEIEKRILEIVYSDGKSLSYSINDSSRKIGFFFSFLYLLTFAISFGMVIYLLMLLEFNIISGIIFFVFFSAVSFFSYRVSQGAQELVLIEKRKTIRETIFEFITFPFIKLGQWLSDKYSKINILVFFLDYLIEIPLKSLLALLEDWSSFINRQKENMLDR
ncbi:MAG: hypothetical protein WDA09_01850 [Bacteriovoracaceae bacterium]